MGHTIRITRQHERQALMVGEVRCRSEGEASWLFHRLCDVLGALVPSESPREEGVQ